METKKYTGKIISTISNKGGVGKTISSIEIANILGKARKKVLLIDTDMNTGDISIKLKLRNEVTLLEFFEKKETDLSNLIKHIHNFDLIPGAGGNFKFANINYLQKLKFIKAFKEISENYDYTILDLGAGIDRVTLDFALTADYTTIVTTPEDIQTGYGCAKAAAERLNENEKRLSSKNRDYIRVHQFSPFFIFNKAKKNQASNIFSGVRRAAEVSKSKDDIRLKPRFLGSVPPDYKLVGRSYSEYHTPISEAYPTSEMAKSYKEIAHFFLSLDNNNGFHHIHKKSPIDKILSLFKNEKEPVPELEY
ncbi:MAG: MinD/ParA family protein [Calditrichaeota bacterium]|nr:MAG: MinD/ParA family protein [Calditrichota bacterium]MBL1204029.1 MinD/ParA family protein [Calditrichota bacterium]NOG43860.1 AAA family ATPase [Calditrichota bacterium]